MERIEFTSRSPFDTIAIGEHIGKAAKAGDLLLLYGELGAGKTQLVKGLAKGIGVVDWQYVLSPSFTLMNVYEGRLDLCHVDLYRVDNGEVDSLDIEGFLETAVIAIEWAEHFPLRPDAIIVRLAVIGEEERRIAMEVEDVGRAQVWRHLSRDR